MLSKMATKVPYFIQASPYYYVAQMRHLAEFVQAQYTVFCVTFDTLRAGEARLGGGFAELTLMSTSSPPPPMLTVVLNPLLLALLAL